MGKPISMWHEQGTNPDYAAIFGCPGWTEQFNIRPAAGQTGHNLEILLDILQDWGAQVPPRDELTITNAWPEAMYDEKDGRGTPLISKVKNVENLKRIVAEIGGTRQWVFCFGDEAKAVAQELVRQRERHPQLQCRFIETRHLGMQSLNHVTCDLFKNKIPDAEALTRNRATASKWYGRFQTPTILRLEVVAAELMAGIGLSIPTVENLDSRRSKRGDQR